MNNKMQRVLVSSILTISLLVPTNLFASRASAFGFFDWLFGESDESQVEETSPAPTETPAPTIADYDSFSDNSSVFTPNKLGFMETSFDGAELTGTGTYTWENGDSYTGDWVDGVASGSGEYHWANGDIYSGEFSNGLPNGQGTATFLDGQTYTGTFVDCEYEGIGVFVFPGIGKYEGEFSASFRHGQGVFTWDTGEVYDGAWAEDQITGYGKLITAEGNVYEGDFTNGVLNGSELLNQVATGSYSVREAEDTETAGTRYIIRYSHREVYEGEVQDDRFHGEGSFTLSDGSTLVGQFENGEFVSGTYTTKINYNSCVFEVVDGCITHAEIKYNTGAIYSGDYKDGVISGNGTMKYSNGDVYEGEFENGLKSGQGTYTWTWQNGAHYTGTWENDQMNGSGTYFYPTWAKGYKLVGNFKDGKPDGQCEFYLTESTHYTTDWKNGSIAKIYE